MWSSNTFSCGANERNTDSVDRSSYQNRLAGLDCPKKPVKQRMSTNNLEIKPFISMNIEFKYRSEWIGKNYERKH